MILNGLFLPVFSPSPNSKFQDILDPNLAHAVLSDLDLVCSGPKKDHFDIVGMDKVSTYLCNAGLDLIDKKSILVL